MTNNERHRIASRFFDEDIRCEQIIWLGCQADQYPDALRDFWNDAGCWEPHKLSEIFSLGAGRPLEFKVDLEMDEPDAFVSWCIDHNLDGFLVCIATPVPEKFHEDGGYHHCGFGHYRIEWFYTEDFSTAFTDRVFKWKEEFIEECRKEQATDADKT